MTPFINSLIADYERNFGPIVYPTYAASIGAVIQHGINNGYLKMIEPKHSHTFGGVTVALTDRELSIIMRLLSEDRKIAAIKEMRVYRHGPEGS